MKFLKLLIKIFLGLGLLINLIFIIAGLFLSWKSALVWFVGAVLLFALFVSFIDIKNSPAKKVVFSKGLRIPLFLASFITFCWGAYLLPDNITKRKNEGTSLVVENNSLIKEQIAAPKVDLEPLKAFQKHWADSILKSETKPGNRHFVNIRLVLPDTILFEYTEAITRLGYNENLMNDTVFYREYYNKELLKKLGTNFDNQNTYISFIPNKNVDFKKIVAEKEAKTERNNKILRQFSQWDGSHRNLERLIKDNMNDPSSFDHVETTYADKGKYILVQMRYRGKNAFGATVLNTTTAKVDIDGNILSIDKY